MGTTSGTQPAKSGLSKPIESQVRVADSWGLLISADQAETAVDRQGWPVPSSLQRPRLRRTLKNSASALSALAPTALMLLRTPAALQPARSPADPQGPDRSTRFTSAGRSPRRLVGTDSHTRTKPSYLPRGAGASRRVRTEPGRGALLGSGPPVAQAWNPSILRTCRNPAWSSSTSPQPTERPPVW